MRELHCELDNRNGSKKIMNVYENSFNFFCDTSEYLVFQRLRKNKQQHKVNIGNLFKSLSQITLKDTKTLDNYFTYYSFKFRCINLIC